MSKFRVLLMSSLFAFGAAHGACAFENGNTPYPPGSPGSNFAELPPIPGIFILEQTNVSSAGSLYDNNGNKQSFPPFKDHAVTNIPRILLSYGIHLPGNGMLYGQIVPPVVFLNTEIFGQKQHTSGLANLTLTPFIGAWHPLPNVSLSSGFDFIIPTGAYSATKPSVATGYMTYSPVLSLRYDLHNGVDIGIQNRLLINSKNGRTGYQSGSAYVADFLAAWNVGDFKLGAAGGFLQQYSDDKVNGQTVQPGGNREETFAIGPSVTYSGLIGGKFPFNINVNYQVGVIAKNTARANNFWLNIGIPIFVPHPPSPMRPVSPSAG